MSNRRSVLGASIAVLLMAAGCGDRPAAWDMAPIVNEAEGLQQSFAIIDEAIHVAQIMSVGPSLSLEAHPQPVGKDVVNVKVAPDGKRLFVLSRGVQPRRLPEDERPALRIYDGTGSGQLLGVYELADPLGGLSLDPEGRYVVVYPSQEQGEFISNPNELVVIDTSLPASATNPLPRTIRSFGGRPRRFTFTPSFSVPSGERRLLIVETDQDIAILDLDHLDRTEVTVRLSDTRKIIPAGVVVSDGASDRVDDTRIAIRTTNESSVYVLTLAQQPDANAPNDFKVEVNIIGLSTVPTDFDFVQTDAGLRLAVLQPSLRLATLVDLDTNVTSEVDMPAAYGSMALITGEVAGAPESGSDVALLWGGSQTSTSAAGVAFWSLGKSVGQAYRSIEVLPDIAASVLDVMAVPSPNNHLKLLMPSNSPSGPIHVLNLQARTASPLNTSAFNPEVTLSRDGQRAWFYENGSSSIAVVDLGSLHPQNLQLDRPVWKLFDVARQDGGRAMVALHRGGTLGATLLDARSPDPTAAVGYAGLLQGGF